jgi:hypothetical protein
MCGHLWTLSDYCGSFLLLMEALALVPCLYCCASFLSALVTSCNGCIRKERLRPWRRVLCLRPGPWPCFQQLQLNDCRLRAKQWASKCVAVGSLKHHSPVFKSVCRHPRHILYLGLCTRAGSVLSNSFFNRSTSGSNWSTSRFIVLIPSAS